MEPETFGILIPDAELLRVEEPKACLGQEDCNNYRADDQADAEPSLGMLHGRASGSRPKARPSRPPKRARTTLL